MKRLLCALLALSLLFGTVSALAAADYTVAEKLLKQLQAGSGFSGTLTLDRLGADGESLLKTPAVIACDGIYVRETEEEPASTRVDLTLQNGEDDLAQAHVWVQEGVVSLQSELIGSSWISLDGLDQSMLTSIFPAEGGDGSLPDYTGISFLLEQVGTYLPKLTGDGLSDLKEDFLLRLDLWLEGWRQTADFGKTEDGSTTMTVNYCVPNAAVKNEAKTLLLDILGNEEAISALTEALGEEEADKLFQEEWQRYYFQAIEQLPIEGDLTIDRVMNLKGETLSLKVSLPLWDAQTGPVTLTYTREAGLTDSPDTQSLTLVGDNNQITLDFTRYTSLEEMEVWQGQIVRTWSEGSMGVEFALTAQITEGVTEEKEESYLAEYSLTLSPLAEAQQTLSAPIEVKLSGLFISATARTAATTITGSFSLKGQDGTTTLLTLEGKSRKKWTPAPITGDILKWSDMDGTQTLSLLTETIGNVQSIAAEYAK